MKPVFTLLVIVGCIIAFSCQPSAEHKTATIVIDTAAIKASIDSLGGVVQKAHDLGDNKMLGQTWAKDGIYAMAGSPPIQGREAIVSFFANMPPLPPGGTMQIHVIDIKVMAPTWAYVSGIDTLKYTLPGATVPVKETSTFFVLVKKTPEGWQTFREMIWPNQGHKR